jgi:hypothetical protein
LAQNIVSVNRTFIGLEHPFSLRNQIAGAVQKHDHIAVQHRTGAWMASYLDVVFAVNRVLHPGEKRQLSFIETECQVLPVAFVDDVRALVGGELAGRRLLEHLDRMVDRLDDLIAGEGVASPEAIEE